MNLLYTSPRVLYDDLVFSFHAQLETNVELYPFKKEDELYKKLIEFHSKLIGVQGDLNEIKDVKETRQFIYYWICLSRFLLYYNKTVVKQSKQDWIFPIGSRGYTNCYLHFTLSMIATHSRLGCKRTAEIIDTFDFFETKQRLTVENVNTLINKVNNPLIKLCYLALNYLRVDWESQTDNIFKHLHNRIDLDYKLLRAVNCWLSVLRYLYEGYNSLRDKSLHDKDIQTLHPEHKDNLDVIARFLYGCDYLITVQCNVTDDMASEVILTEQEMIDDAYVSSLNTMENVHLVRTHKLYTFVGPMIRSVDIAINQLKIYGLYYRIQKDRSLDKPTLVQLQTKVLIGLSYLQKTHNYTHEKEDVDIVLTLQLLSIFSIDKPIFKEEEKIQYFKSMQFIQPAQPSADDLVLLFSLGGSEEKFLSFISPSFSCRSFTF